jgi:DNA-binding transcriptional LysR family regulator
VDRFLGISVFVAAVEGGSIAAAGRRCGLSAVMAGRYLAALEAEVKARLVERSTRRLSLTDAGRAYFARSKQILDALQEADDEAAAMQTVPRGVLRVAAPVTFGSMYLGPLLAAFMAEFPEVDIVLRLEERFVDLVGEGVDLAIRIGRLPESDLVARRLGECRLMACASPEYLARAGVPRTTKELESHSLVGYLNAEMNVPWTFVDAQGRSSDVVARRRLSVTSTAVMLEVVRSGFGIAYALDFVFAGALERGELVQVLADHSSPRLPVSAITPTARHVNTKTRLFIERLKEAFTSPAPWERWAMSPAPSRHGRRPGSRR